MIPVTERTFYSEKQTLWKNLKFKGRELKKMLYKEAQKLSGLSCLTTAEPEVCGGKNNFNHLTPGADTEGGGH